MKQIENNFAVSGFVGKDAEIRQFANASVARFSLAVSRQEKSGEETKRVSAFLFSALFDVLFVNLPYNCVRG